MVSCLKDNGLADRSRQQNPACLVAICATWALFLIKNSYKEGKSWSLKLRQPVNVFLFTSCCWCLSTETVPVVVQCCLWFKHLVTDWLTPLNSTDWSWFEWQWPLFKVSCKRNQKLLCFFSPRFISMIWVKCSILPQPLRLLKTILNSFHTIDI